MISEEPSVRANAFNDRNVTWHQMPGLSGMMLSIFNVDTQNKTVDFIVKFAPNTRVLVHRHLALTHTFVVEGDHVIYESDGSLRESRPIGCYTVSEVTGDIHNEGGGPDGCTLLYSVRSESESMFDTLDNELNVVATLGLAEFQQLLEMQAAANG